MDTPYFLIDKYKLDKNIFDFQNALRQLWPHSELAYSVKTNALPWLLKYLKKQNVLAEVVSDEEYALAKMSGYEDNDIVYNGPIKGEKQFKDAVQNGAYINLDSKKDLEYLKKYACARMRIGIRVNVPSELFYYKDIGYEEDGFRFGFSEKNGDFLYVLNMIRSLDADVQLGLHLHCNSVTRSIEVYRTIAKYAALLIDKYKLNLSFIDMGGGYFGGVEGKPTPYNYIQTFIEELNSVVNIDETKLIVEPGSALIGSVAELHTSVVDVKDTAYARIVTTDGSRIYIDPLWAKSKYLYSLKTQKSNYMPKQIICGYTCMDHDRIMTLENCYELSINDKIIYQRVGAYTMTFGGMFIRCLPDVYVQEENKIEKVRSRITMEDYYNIYT